MPPLSAKYAACTALTGLLLAAAAPVHAAGFTGKVQDERGQPLAGVMVSVFNAAQDRKETVYTTTDPDPVRRNTDGTRPRPCLAGRPTDGQRWHETGAGA